MSPATAETGGVRRAVRRDLDIATELWLAIGRHHTTLDPSFELRRGAESEARRLLEAMLGVEEIAIFVFDSGNGPVGLCIVRVDRAPPITAETLRAEITDIGVRRDMRRKGMGRALAQAAQAWAREQGAARIEIRVARGNEEGQAFWRGLGFDDFMDVLHRRTR